MFSKKGQWRVDVIAAANTAAEVALRLVSSGKKVLQFYVLYSFLRYAFSSLLDIKYFLGLMPAMTIFLSF